MVLDGRPADAFDFVDGGMERDRAEDVGGAGFFAFGRVGPRDFVEVDEVDGAATGEERVTVGEGASRPDEGAGAEGGVHLVPAPRHEVDRGWQTSVGCELGGVHEDGHAALVGGDGDVVDRGHPAGDVRRAADGQQLRMRCDVEGRRDVLDGEGAIGLAFDEPAAGHACPRQQVGVMLDDGGDDDIVRAEGESVGEVVDGLGGVAADDRHVVAVGGPPGEPQHGGASMLVGVGGDTRLVASAAMDAGVPGEELVDP